MRTGIKWWKVRYWLSECTRVMLWPFTAPAKAWQNHVHAKRAHELQLMEVQASVMTNALVAVNQQNTALMTEVAKGSQESAKVLQQWLEGFKVVEMPKQGTTAMTDELEAVLERERRITADIPVQALPASLPADTVAWLSEGIGEMPKTSYSPIRANHAPTSRLSQADLERILN